jgi:hypothetical protein
VHQQWQRALDAWAQYASQASTRRDHPSARPRYWMLGQFGGTTGMSIRRFDLVGSCGTSWTATVDA